MKQSILVEGWEFHTSVVPIPVCPCIPYTLSNSPCPVWLLAQPSWIKFRSGSTVNIAWKSNLTLRSHWAALTNGYSSQLHAILWNTKHLFGLFRIYPNQSDFVWFVSCLGASTSSCAKTMCHGTCLESGHEQGREVQIATWTERSFQLTPWTEGIQKATNSNPYRDHSPENPRIVYPILFEEKRDWQDPVCMPRKSSPFAQTVWSHWRCSYILRCTRVKGWRLVEVLTWAVSYGRVRTSVTLQKLHVHCTFLLWTYAVMTFQVWKWVSEFQNFWLGRPAHKVRHARDSVCGTRMISRTLQKRATCF